MKSKKFLSAILSCIMFLSLFTNRVSAVYDNDKTNIAETGIEDAIEHVEQASTTEINNIDLLDSDNKFYGNISVINDNISANNIAIQVYNSELIYSEDGVNQYNHYLKDTVLTDSNGSFSFYKPTSPFLIKVVLETLPYGTGIDHETVFYSNNEVCDILSLAYVDDIEISKNDNNSYNVTLLSSNGTPIYANYHVDETLSTNSDNITYNNIDNLQIYKNVNICVGNTNKSMTFIEDTDNLSVIQKVNYLESLDLINQNEKINIFYEKWNELSDIDKYIDEFGIGQTLYNYATNNELELYSESNFNSGINNKLISEINSLSSTASNAKPTYTNGKEITVGNFKLHYESGLSQINNYKTVLNNINTTFFSTYSFYEPYHEYLNGSTKRDSYFHIYLVDKSYLNSVTSDYEEYDGNVVGKSIPIDSSDVTQGSYILMSTISDITSFGKTLSHEIFHAIEYRYAGKKPTSWFSESFANYGSILYLNGTCSTLTSQVKDYLNSTEYSLNNTSAYGNRHYGEVLLPLYIHNNMGGVNTIKNILSEYASVTSAYTAIENGLKKSSSNYTFAKAFYEHANYNAYTTYYKKPNSTTSIGFGANAHRTNTKSLGDSSNENIPSTTLQMNSSRYYEFSSTSTSNRTLTITISTTSNVNYSAYNIVKKSSKYSIPTQKAATAITTFTVSDFSANSTNTVILVAANTSKSSSNTNTFSASITTK